MVDMAETIQFKLLHSLLIFIHATKGRLAVGRVDGLVRVGVPAVVKIAVRAAVKVVVQAEVMPVEKCLHHSRPKGPACFEDVRVERAFRPDVILRVV
jgi:hypothetical protein